MALFLLLHLYWLSYYICIGCLSPSPSYAEAYLGVDDALVDRVCILPGKHLFFPRFSRVLNLDILPAQVGKTQEKIYLG